MTRARVYQTSADRQKAYRDRKRNTPRAESVTNGGVMETPVKPLMRYFGGKWLLAEWIIEHLPVHRIYTETYGGAASVLFRKPRSFSEVYNDLDGEIVNLFRVCRDRSACAELKRALTFTPFAREELMAAYEVTEEPIERARRLLVRSWMGHATGANKRNTGFRTNVVSSRRSAPARDWMKLIDTFDTFMWRLQGVTIENRPAVDVIRGHDSPETLHYIDTPYVLSTRSEKNVYRFEMTDEDHRDLAAVVRNVRGMVVLSGYPSGLYDDELYADWHRVECKAFAEKHSERTEVLWMNEPSRAALVGARAQLSMFD